MDAGEERVVERSGSVQRRVGELLRERRVALGLTQADVANMVKLPARRIDAMECERWSELPDGPYLRGFLRNVAKALDLDAAELVARVDSVQADAPPAALVAPGVTHITLPRRSGPADDRHGGRKLVFGAFAFALVAAVIAWSGTSSFEHVVDGARSLIDARRGDVVVASAAPPQNDSAGPAAPGVVVAPSPAIGSDAHDEAATVSPSRAAVAGAPGTSAAEQALRFHFNDKSWVEVRSSDGKVLLQQLNAAGSEQAVAGDPPFTLVVGNAKGVELHFRGQPVDLKPYIRDSVARFTLS